MDMKKSKPSQKAESLIVSYSRNEDSESDVIVVGMRDASEPDGMKIVNVFVGLDCADIWKRLTEPCAKKDSQKNHAV